MAIHTEVLQAARRLCEERGGWTFRVDEVVRALPHLNPRSVRTHVVSRCCANAPRNHPHKWDYFRRVGRGTYEILPGWRKGEAGASRRRPRAEPVGRDGRASAVTETRSAYRARGKAALRDTVHAVVQRQAGAYVAECLEIAAVTQGRSLDELVENLREAVALHLEGEDPETTGLAPAPRIAVLYEFKTSRDDAAK